MIDILVISHASFRRVNRLVYNYLSSRYQLDMRILSPIHLNMNGEKLKADKQKENDIEVIFRDLKGTNPRIYSFEGTISILNNLKPKLIYLDNDPVSLQALTIGRWASKNNSILICLSCENLRFDIKSSFQRLGFKGIPSAVFKMWMSKLTRKYISHVFCINQSGFEIFTDLKFKSVSITPLGYDPNVFYPNEDAGTLKRKELGIKDDTVIIAYIGRTVFEKGIHVLLKSLSMLTQQNWVFILDKFCSAKTSYQNEILLLIEKYGLTEKVKYFDASHFEVAAYMNAADVIVIPSISTSKWVEQYGRVAPEAMACGKLVIASNTGALPEIIKDCGILFEQNDHTMLKEILDSVVIDFNSYKKITENAFDRANAHYTNIIQANLLYEKFNYLINNRF